MVKNLKRTVCSLLSLIMIIPATLLVKADAPALDETKPNFQIESKSVNKGEELDVSVNISNNPGFWSVKLSITCDDVLSFVKQDDQPIVETSAEFDSKGEGIINYDCGVLTYFYMANSDTANVTSNGTLFSFKIKADNDAVTGDYNISFTDYSSSNFINVDAQKVSFTFGDGKISVTGKNLSEVSDTNTYDYSFDAVNCVPTAPSGGTLGKYTQSDISPNMTISTFKPSESGQYVEYTLSDLPVGEYDLYTFSRDYTTRGVFDVYVDGTLLNTISFIETSVQMKTREVGSFQLTEQKDVTIRFVAGETLNYMYLAGFYLNKDRPKYVYEEKTVSIYTMDEGSRPSVFGVTKDCPNTAEFTSVSNDNVLSFARISGTVTLINHSVYFKLPDDIFTKYDNLISLSISIRTDYGSFYSHNSGFNRIYMSSYPTESPNSQNAVKVASSSTYKFTTTPTVFTIDLTSDTGKYIINNDFKYFNIINSVENNNGNSYNYLYIDDVQLVYNKAVDNSKVMIDGVLKDTVENGDSFILPNDNDNTVAYKDSDRKIYACGESVVINKDTSFQSVKLNLTTKPVASMRLKESEALNKITGIRFYTELDTDTVKSLREANINVELGTLVAPKNYFGSKPLSDLKFDVDFGQIVNYADIKFSSNDYFVEDDFCGIVASLVNIKDDHATWDFVARGYAKISVNGSQSKIIYASENNLPQKNISYLAYKTKNDTDFFGGLNSNQQSLVNYYCAIYNETLFDPYELDKF